MEGMYAILCLPFTLRFHKTALLNCRVGFFICFDFYQQKKTPIKRVFLYFGSYYALRTLVAWGPR
jgi:hypothetical protein